MIENIVNKAVLEFTEFNDLLPTYYTVNVWKKSGD